jgi:GT2 family glycosyltransferase
MITIGYSSRNHNQKHYEHLLNSVGLKNVEVFEIINNGNLSLPECYNEILKKSKFNINVYVHDDIKLEKGWGKKLLQDFNDNPEFGIIGKAGSCYFPKSGVYWERLHQTMVGQVYHHPVGQKKFLSRYSPKLPILIPVVTIDGLFMAFDKNKIKHKFDQSYGKFHFYDHGFCIPNYIDGVRIGVTSSFEITHESVGQPNDEFYRSKDEFVEKWGHVLPLDLKPEKIYVPQIKRKSFKRFGKVGIIIPTKGKIEMLTECLLSFYEHCDTNIFNIYIADTGSTDDEKTTLKEFIKDYDNIKLIEYDYYNFAKINNDVIKNHVDNNIEFLLFCNNDIKLLNDVISGMLDIFNKNPKTGTVGCRLHFEDNTIQHDGVFIAQHRTNRTIHVGHLNINNYWNYSNTTKEVIGNTGGLLMIRKNSFTNIGMFNEKYTSCFEDVELNILINCNGFTNYLCGDCVAYHYESQTRNEDPDNLKKLNDDYLNTLFPVINRNWEKIKDKVMLI